MMGSQCSPAFRPHAKEKFPTPSPSPSTLPRLPSKQSRKKKEEERKKPGRKHSLHARRHSRSGRRESIATASSLPSAIGVPSEDAIAEE